MRCQWGTTWENMQPWIVARRYREFDVLNFQVTYGNSASVLTVVCTYIVLSHLVLSEISCTQFNIYIFLPCYPFLFRPYTHFYSPPFLLFLPPSVATLLPFPSQCNAHTSWERFLQLPWCTCCGQKKESIGRIYDSHRAKAAHCKLVSLFIYLSILQIFHSSIYWLTVSSICILDTSQTSYQTDNLLTVY